MQLKMSQGKSSKQMNQESMLKLENKALHNYLFWIWVARLQDALLLDADSARSEVMLDTCVSFSRLQATL